VKYLPLIAVLALPAFAGNPPKHGVPKPPPREATQQQAQSTASQSTSHATSTATQSQSAASNQSQQASNEGNIQSTITEYQRQVASAYAPSIQPTTVCATARSGGVSTAVLGFSGGRSGVDLECEARETARLFAEIGFRQSAILIACATVAAQRAFNGRPCPLAEPEAQSPLTEPEAALQSATERAEAHGFRAPGK
jgi:hypothetical protein